MKFWMIFLVLVGLIISILVLENRKVIEGYESLTKCIEQGYPDKFCLNVPPQSVLRKEFTMWKPKH